MRTNDLKTNPKRHSAIYDWLILSAGGSQCLYRYAQLYRHLAMCSDKTVCVRAVVSHGRKMGKLLSHCGISQVSGSE